MFKLDVVVNDGRSFTVKEITSTVAAPRKVGRRLSLQEHPSIKYVRIIRQSQIVSGQPELRIHLPRIQYLGLDISFQETDFELASSLFERLPFRLLGNLIDLRR